jgi:preprotein translocase subunit SecD
MRRKTCSTRLLVLLAAAIAALCVESPPASAESLRAIVVSQETEITADDVDRISMTYSSLNQVMLVKITFNESGRKKLQDLLKANLDRKLCLSMGNDVVLIPVPIKTEEPSDTLTIGVADEQAALRLLKNLSR